MTVYTYTAVLYQTTYLEYVANIVITCTKIANHKQRAAQVLTCRTVCITLVVYTLWSLHVTDLVFVCKKSGNNQTLEIAYSFRFDLKLLHFKARPLSVES